MTSPRHARPDPEPLADPSADPPAYFSTPPAPPRTAPPPVLRFTGARHADTAFAGAPPGDPYPTDPHPTDPHRTGARHDALAADTSYTDVSYTDVSGNGETLGALPAGRVTGDRDPSETEIEEAATVVETALQSSRDKADRATRGVLSALLALEALVVLLVPRAIAQTDTGLDRTKTILLVALAVVLLATAFLMRRPWAVALGSALQVVLLATGLLEWVMVVIAVVFIGLWVWVLTMRRDWVRTPGGLRMLVS